MTATHPLPAAAGSRVSRPFARILAGAALWLASAGAVLSPASAAGPVYWDWPAGRPFADLELAGAAIDLSGALVAGLSLVTPQGKAPEVQSVVGGEVVWTVVPDGKGGYYSGTGHDGQIFHTDAGGATELVADLEAAEVFCLLPLTGGGLLAGCGPEGQVFAVAADGRTELLGAAAGGYVWSMVQDSKTGDVWLATGSPAAVCRLAGGKGPLQEVAALPAQNAMDILAVPGLGWLVATQGPGLVLTIDQGDPSAARVVLETPQDEARQLLSDPAGGCTVLALSGQEKEGAEVEDVTDGGNGEGENRGNARRVAPRTMPLLFGEGTPPAVPRAALYRLDAEGGVQTLWTGDLDLMIVAWDPKLGWLGAGPLDSPSGLSVLYLLGEGAGATPLARWQGGDILDLKIVPGTNGTRVLVAQAHPGRVDVLADGAGAGPRFAVSPPLDGGRPLAWGRLTWSGQEGPGQVRWSVRGGNSSRPDSDWTPWSQPWTQNDHPIALEPCRFLQWRVELPAPDAEGRTWRIFAVAVSAWRDNQPPVITAFAREHVQGVFLGGLMAHRENVTRTFHSGLKAEFNRGQNGQEEAPLGRAALGRSVEVFTWSGNDPDGDRLDFTLEYRKVGDRLWKTAAADLDDLLGSWETVGVPDGLYEVRLTASDGRDNPEALAQSARRILGPVPVDNTPPVIRDLAVTRDQATRDRVTLRVAFRSEDGLSALAGASVILPDGSSRRLDPVDRICDSRAEEFAADVAWPETAALAVGADPWVRVEVQDLAGNVAATEGEVR